MRLLGRGALVTAGADMIGKATPASLLRQGASVTIVDSNRAAVEKATAELKVLRDKFCYVAGDICTRRNKP